MQQFNYVLKSDYDKRVRIDGENVLCYSASRLKAVHPDANIKGSLEARSYTNSEKKPKKNGAPSLYEQRTLGEMPIGIKRIGISAAQSNSPLLYKKVGYVCLEDGSFVALCISRLPFFILLTTLLALLVAGSVVLLSLLGEESPAPNHPLPPVDDNLTPDEGDPSDPIQSPDGGGAVSMIYTLGAKIIPSTGKIDIHFKNPRVSNHSVAVELYIVSNGVEYLIAKSGLIPPGNGLYELTMLDTAPTLSQGKYDALYRVFYYDPVTGVRANVQSDITDVVATVVP